MKKLIATLCFALGLTATTFAAEPSAIPVPSSPNVTSIQETNKSSKPDHIYVVMDEKGRIVEIIVVKNR